MPKARHRSLTARGIHPLRATRQCRQATTSRRTVVAPAGEKGGTYPIQGTELRASLGSRGRQEGGGAEIPFQFRMFCQSDHHIPRLAGCRARRPAGTAVQHRSPTAPGAASLMLPTIAGRAMRQTSAVRPTRPETAARDLSLAGIAPPLVRLAKRTHRRSRVRPRSRWRSALFPPESAFRVDLLDLTIECAVFVCVQVKEAFDVRFRFRINFHDPQLVLAGIVIAVGCQRHNPSRRSLAVRLPTF